ncbi:MAG: outer membrane lipoprotein carrier protein LolA [Mesorhizobium sp.]|jgi:outer membrane lipoprotein-sorting protein
MNDRNEARGPLLSRRRLLGLSIAVGGLVGAGQLVPAWRSVAAAQAAPSAAAQKIADHFSAIRTMTGDFIQFGPRGEQTGGKFFIARPGKLRFNYEAPSGFRVISDGKSVVIDNRRLNTMDLYPLSKTPLKLLLDDRIDLSGKRVKSVKEDGDSITIQMADRSVFGSSRITMTFDARTYDLRQWTITDAQGKDTTVVIDNVQRDVALDAGLFVIDYKRNYEVNRKNKNRSD